MGVDGIPHQYVRWGAMLHVVTMHTIIPTAVAYACCCLCLPFLIIALAYACCCLCLLSLQVISVSDAKDGRLSVTYASTAPLAAADGSTAAAAAPEEQQQQQLVVNALVLATGGFGASKEMLRVRALGMCVGEGGERLQKFNVDHLQAQHANLFCCCRYKQQSLLPGLGEWLRKQPQRDAAAGGTSAPTQACH
jgi:hypothetical protein